MFNLAASSGGFSAHAYDSASPSSAFCTNFNFLTASSAAAGPSLPKWQGKMLPISLTSGISLSQAAAKVSLNESDDSDEHFNRHLENLRGGDQDASESSSKTTTTAAAAGEMKRSPCEPKMYAQVVIKPKTPVVIQEVTEPPTPMDYSRSSSMTSLNSFDAKSVHSSVASEYSLQPSKMASPVVAEVKAADSSSTEEDEDNIDEIDITIPESPAAPNDSFLNSQRLIHKQQQIQYRQSAMLAMSDLATSGHQSKPETAASAPPTKDEPFEFEFNKQKPLVFDFGATASKFTAASGSFVMTTPPVKLAPKFAQQSAAFPFVAQSSSSFLAAQTSPLPFPAAGYQPTKSAMNQTVTYAFMKNSSTGQPLTTGFSLTTQPKFLMNRQNPAPPATYLSQANPGMFAMKPVFANAGLTTQFPARSMGPSSSSASFDENPVVYSKNNHSNQSSPPESVCSRMSNASVPSLIRDDISKSTALFNTMMQKVSSSACDKGASAGPSSSSNPARSFGFRDMLLNLNINDLAKPSGQPPAQAVVKNADEDGGPDSDEHHQFCCDEEECSQHCDYEEDDEQPEKFETEDELVVTFQKGASISDHQPEVKSSFKFGLQPSCLTPPSAAAAVKLTCGVDKMTNNKFAPGFVHAMSSGHFFAKSPATTYSTPMAPGRIQSTAALVNLNDSNCTYSPQVFNYEGSMSRYSSVSSLDNLDDLDNDDDDDAKNRIIIAKLCTKKLFKPDEKATASCNNDQVSSPSAQNISASSLNDTDEAVEPKPPSSTSRAAESSSSANNSDLNGTLDPDDLILENFINEMLPSVLSTASFQADLARPVSSPAKQPAATALPKQAKPALSKLAADKKLKPFVSAQARPAPVAKPVPSSTKPGVTTKPRSVPPKPLATSQVSSPKPSAGYVPSRASRPAQPVAAKINPAKPAAVPKKAPIPAASNPGVKSKPVVHSRPPPTTAARAQSSNPDEEPPFSSTSRRSIIPAAPESILKKPSAAAKASCTVPVTANRAYIHSKPAAGKQPAAPKTGPNIAKPAAAAKST